MSARAGPHDAVPDGQTTQAPVPCPDLVASRVLAPRLALQVSWGVTRNRVCMAGEIEALERWYEAQCDGDWEHEFGIRISTLDNPGWAVDIPLEGTPLEGRDFTPVEEMAPERTWISCKVSDGEFRGRGGAPMLGRILRTFLEWARDAPPSAEVPAG